MRIFALLLLAANLAHLGWYLAYGRSAVPDALVRSPTRDAPLHLMLLSELDEADRCFEVGTFAGEEEGERFAASARALGYRAELSPLRISEPPDYWVHMPPFVSEAAAQRRLAELRGRNIDSYLISGGELDGGISLGLFTRRESALRLQEQLANQGYDSEIRELNRSRSEFRALVAGVRGSGEVPAQWAELLAGWPDLRQVEKLCETIAPPSQFP